MSRRRENEIWRETDPLVRRAFANSLSAGLPSKMLALYARWVQFESWIRALVYLELRAKLGADWLSVFDQKTLSRAAKDQRADYMAAPERAFLPSYMDVSALLGLIDQDWPLFEQHLLHNQAVWRGRLEELLRIRNRIAHSRQPHVDDLGRIEQMLRDLEAGASRAITSYNSRESPPTDLDDPIVEDWVRRRHETAVRLIEHGRNNYGITFNLLYTVRPWAEYDGGVSQLH